MQFIVRKYYSGFYTYEVEANSEDQAYEIAGGMPLNYDEILGTLEPWEDCDGVEPVGNN